ncbi:N-acetylmuramoyl-L-alanine amidase [Roseibacterium elongatum DSM 19469]|uniref:N-acetylmuramoyl-L-alanine amidase n=1 Tax=Roseicyclus elongatus DSM 19469 TaxID=1294273 RepID=W8S6F2_9RHOB|nr:N-acetylmuramoyl-L-alanine amidase [Roseibacterium elongatum]AHM04411.1 N-acetylmuramoyl-L-alanine amidase [Roseibacterium elongatum DSM 19469]
MRSPNHGPRRGGHRPELVVLHYTAMTSCDAAERALCDPAREVSAHYLISRTGDVIQLVAEDRRAWHAGAGTWRGAEDVNSRSIGIELDNDGFSPFAAPLMDALEDTLAGLLARWSIAPQGVIAHSDMAPARKSDPGPRFDWRRLARQGLAIWPEWTPANGTDPHAFRRDARAFGYPDLSDELLLRALRLHFRPAAAGPLDAIDCGIAAELAARYGD